MVGSGRRVGADAGRHAGQRRSRPRWLYVGCGLAVLVLLIGAAVAVSKHFGSAAARDDAASSQSDLPSWAIGPFVRYSHNPILSSPVVPTATTRWEWPELFNPGVVVVDGVFHMLYRGTNNADVSAIGAASSTDGYHFTEISSSPVIPHSLPSENQGVEDPRLYYLDGKYYAFYTGDSGATPGAAIDINEAVSTNAVQWNQLGPVLRNTKDAAVVASPEGTPVQIDGHYLMYYGQGSATYLAQSPDMVHWTTIGPVETHLPPSYAPDELCVAVTDYRTTASGDVQAGIDLFVAGELMGHGRWYYAISEIEFSRSALQTSAAQLANPVLYPQAAYEIYGHTPETVFMNDIIFYHGEWWMYYGGGDSVVALAQAKLRQN